MSIIKTNTNSKRESTNRENLFKASLIGLANVYGIDLTIRMPQIMSLKQITYDNLMIQQTSLFPIEGSFDDIKNRNERKSFTAMIFNRISEHLINEYHLDYKMAKKRTTTKTVKLEKYVRIGPFNGFRPNEHAAFG